MIPIKSFEQLERQLKAMITDRNASMPIKADPLNAYKKGLEDALTLVREFRKQGQSSKKDKNMTTTPSPAAAAPKLNHIPPEHIARMGLEDPEKRKKKNITDKDLTEAAFHFENQLLELLGDDNTIPFDAYEGLEPVKLAAIIQSCVEKICRLQKNQ